MLTGDELLEDLYKRQSELESEIEKLHESPERRVKESYLQDVRNAVEKLKKGQKNDGVKY